MSDKEIQALIYTQGAALVIFLAKEIYGFFKRSGQEHVKALHENTLAIQALEIEMKHIAEKLEQIPKIKDDVNNAYVMIRELRASQKR
jgi:hypothetical protein